MAGPLPGGTHPYDRHRVALIARPYSTSMRHVCAIHALLSALSDFSGRPPPNTGDVVFAISCVYDARLSEARAKAYVEKLVLLTAPLRPTAAWRTGGTLAAQRSFGPTLQQQMQQVAVCWLVAVVPCGCGGVID